MEPQVHAAQQQLNTLALRLYLRCAHFSSALGLGERIARPALRPEQAPAFHDGDDGGAGAPAAVPPAAASPTRRLIPSPLRALRLLSTSQAVFFLILLVLLHWQLALGGPRPLWDLDLVLSRVVVNPDSGAAARHKAHIATLNGRTPLMHQVLSSQAALPRVRADPPAGVADAGVQPSVGFSAEKEKEHTEGSAGTAGTAEGSIPQPVQPSQQLPLLHKRWDVKTNNSGLCLWPILAKRWDELQSAQILRVRIRTPQKWFSSSSDTASETQDREEGKGMAHTIMAKREVPAPDDTAAAALDALSDNAGAGDTAAADVLLSDVLLRWLGFNDSSTGSADTPGPEALAPASNHDSQDPSLPANVSPADESSADDTESQHDSSLSWRSLVSPYNVDYNYYFAMDRGLLYLHDSTRRLQNITVMTVEIAPNNPCWGKFPTRFGLILFFGYDTRIFNELIDLWGPRGYVLSAEQAALTYLSDSVPHRSERLETMVMKAFGGSLAPPGTPSFFISGSGNSSSAPDTAVIPTDSWRFVGGGKRSGPAPTKPSPFLIEDIVDTWLDHFLPFVDFEWQLAKFSTLLFIVPMCIFTLTVIVGLVTIVVREGQSRAFCDLSLAAVQVLTQLRRVSSFVQPTPEDQQRIRSLQLGRLFMGSLVKYFVLVFVLVAIAVVVSDLMADATLALLLIALVWLADAFLLMCGRTRATAQMFPKFFWIYALSFLVYDCVFPFGYSYIAFAVAFCCTDSTIMYFFTAYECPAVSEGRVSEVFPREWLRRVLVRRVGHTHGGHLHGPARGPAQGPAQG